MMRLPFTKAQPASNTEQTEEADVCLILEGTYPYVSGGVSGWVHELIRMHADATFVLVCLLPPGAKCESKYDVPENVVSIQHVTLQECIAAQTRPRTPPKTFYNGLSEALQSLFAHASLPDLEQLITLLKSQPHCTLDMLLNTPQAMQILLERYEADMPDSPFIDYFWSWRALLGGMYSVLLAPLPTAKCYHALCTGYAGLMLARAQIETRRPCLLTEHGIYTNERRIEIMVADWLNDQREITLDVSDTTIMREMRDFWADCFTLYSKLTYEAAVEIITLYEGNQSFQRMDGAQDDKMRVIPNGIDVERFSALERSTDHPPTVALIGRVVPIKDVKTFIRSMHFLHLSISQLRVLILGPQEEDEHYAEECHQLVASLGMQHVITFTGKVNVLDYLPAIDVLALTSLSESQPLSILEAAAAGIPSVATNVGSCSELLEGNAMEQPRLHPGGLITPLANPHAIAKACATLLKDKDFYRRCSEAARLRVATYYHKDQQHAFYHSLYTQFVTPPTLSLLTQKQKAA